MKRILTMTIGILIFTCMEAQDIDYEKLGVVESSVENLKAFETGDEAPDFNFYMEGDSISLSSYAANNQVVLIFYRGAWCPICNEHLESFEKDLTKLKMVGIKAIAVTPQTDDNNKAIVKETGLSIPVVSDIDGRIMQLYNVGFQVTEDYQNKIKVNYQKDIAETNGTKTAWLPVPATYVIGTDMKIDYAHFDMNYKMRPDVDEIIEELGL